MILTAHTTSSVYYPPDKAYKDLTQIACAMIGGECLKFPDEKFGDMCNCDECTITPANKICPFEANIMYNITVDVPLSTAFPKVSHDSVYLLFRLLFCDLFKQNLMSPQCTLHAIHALIPLHSIV